jgi:hypothetical protein
MLPKKTACKLFKDNVFGDQKLHTRAATGGLNVSRRSYFEDQLLDCQIRDRSA